MKTIKTIKKLAIITLTAGSIMNVQAEGYFSYYSSLLMPRYEAFMKSSADTLQATKIKALHLDKQVSDYAMEKSPWLKEHTDVLTGVKYGVLLASVASTCWMLKKAYNKLCGLREQREQTAAAPVVKAGSVKAIVSQFDAKGVSYKAKSLPEKQEAPQKEEASQEKKVTFKEPIAEVVFISKPKSASKKARKTMTKFTAQP